MWLSLLWLATVLVGRAIAGLASGAGVSLDLFSGLGIAPYWLVVATLFFLVRGVIRKVRTKQGHLQRSPGSLTPHQGGSPPSGGRVAWRVLAAFGITFGAVFLFTSCATSFMCSAGCP